MKNLRFSVKSRSLFTSVLSFVVFLFTGCAAISRPPLSPQQLQEDADFLRQNHQTMVEEMVNGLARRLKSRNATTLDILMLSGGGQNGAYGIGFLRGWKQRSDSPMPFFDLVTGISTGALQAPFAFLGSSTDLDEAGQLYRDAATDFAPTFDWLFWLRKTGGLVNTEKYRQVIAKTSNEATRTRLKKAFAENRQLAIASSDFDLGIGRTWNLAHELTASPEALARTQQILYAATAIPGIFPPEIIDGHVHADGGVVSNLLPLFDLKSYQRLAASIQTLGISKRVTVRVWVIMNLWTHPQILTLDPSNRTQLANRGNSLLFYLAQPQVLQRLRELSQAVSNLRNLKMEMHTVSIPTPLSNEAGAQTLFDAAWMKKLEDLGFERAQSAAPWDLEIPSPYERPVVPKIPG